MKCVLPLVLLMCIMMSCSKDKKKDLLGTWSYDMITVNGKPSPYQHAANCQKDYFRFSIEQSIFYMHEEFLTKACNDCDDCPTLGTVREWTLEGEHLNLYVSKLKPPSEYTLISVDKNTLKYAYQTDYDKDGVIDQVEITAHRYTPN